MKKLALLFILIAAIASCRKSEVLDESEYDPRLSGGLNTVFDRTSRAYTHAFPTLSGMDLIVHGDGDGAFEQTFVSAPAPVNSGLGPIYNNVSCISCHHNDGSGLPTAGESQSSLLFRISKPGFDAEGRSIALEGYGTQLQDKATFGKSPECEMQINFSLQPVNFPDGTTDTLWVPQYTLANEYFPISSAYLISPRLAPPVFGLGMLEAISVDDLKTFEDVNDNDADGISGKINYVWDPVSHSKKPGRFGHKANTATLLAQVAGAYNQDMGITSSVFPVENSFGQNQYDNLLDDAEIHDSVLHAVTFYVQTLAVPARRDVTHPTVVQGEEIFNRLKCNSCHKQTVHTSVNVAAPFLSNQRIHPYTDLLVHDMGPGLADGRNDFDADGREWRTAPLWGIGLRDVVNYPAFYLHDGRARTLSQAILWHDGEAKSSVDSYKELSKTERDALIRFLKSL